MCNSRLAHNSRLAQGARQRQKSKAALQATEEDEEWGSELEEDAMGDEEQDMVSEEEDFVPRVRTCLVDYSVLPFISI